MSDEKKTNQTADHEKARQSGDPFAREDADGKAKETARADEKAQAQNEQAAAGTTPRCTSVFTIWKSV